MGSVASSLSWLLGEVEDPRTFDRVAYPLMTALCVALAALLWWSKTRALRFVGLVGYAGALVFLIAKTYHIFYVGRSDVLDELSEISPWLPVLIFGAFLVFGVRGGLIGSLLFYGAFLGVTLPSMITEPLAAGDVNAIEALIQLYMSNAVVIVVLFGLARLAEDYVKTRAFSEVMERLANTDFLTGTHNRRHLYDSFKKEIEESARYGRPLPVIMLDLDHFKAVNDVYGHDIGDLVLKGVACLVDQSLRRTDRLSRWGGEEFMVLAPETTLERARASALRLKRAIEDHSFEKVDKVTASFGVAAYRTGDTPETLLKRADEALYRAKQNGRNRVEEAA